MILSVDVDPQSKGTTRSRMLCPRTFSPRTICTSPYVISRRFYVPERLIPEVWDHIRYYSGTSPYVTSPYVTSLCDTTSYVIPRRFYILISFIPERAVVFKMPIPCLPHPRTFHPQSKRVHFQTFVP
jgi:hypothetical protein